MQARSMTRAQTRSSLPSRILNTSCAMDICRLTYLAAMAQQPAPSPNARRLSDYALDLSRVLLRHQGADGGLYSGPSFYTSVYYPAKSLMDLADCLGACGRTADADALEPQITACLKNLLSRGDNIGETVSHSFWRSRALPVAHA